MRQIFTIFKNGNRNLLLVFASMMLWSATSCTLNVIPETAQTFTNSYQTENDFQMSIYSILGEFKRNFIDENLQIKMGILTDYNQPNFSPSTLHSLSNWTSDYNVIYLCNSIVENIGQSDANMTKEQQNYYLGQAYFFKGLSYYNIGRKFGDAIITEGTQKYSAYAKSPAVDVLNEAIADVTKAYDLLPEYGSATDATGKVVMKCYGNKGACAALLANLYAWKASMADLYKWSSVDQTDCNNQAIKWCTTIINNPIYSFESSRAAFVATELNNGVSRANAIDRSRATESIFEFQQYSNGISSDLGSSIPSALALSYPARADISVRGTADSASIVNDGRIWFKLMQSTVQDMYKKADGTYDQRYSAYFWWGDANKAFPPVSVSGGYAYTAKWNAGIFVTQGSRLSYKGVDGNILYFRLSSIYLLRAECYNANGATALAMADLNKIRSICSADLYPAASDNSDLKRAIFNEESKDLIWEGDRYYNVVRNHYYLTDLNQHTPQVTSPIYFDNLSEQDVQEGALYLPVGSTAFTLNDLMRQNIYWSRQGIK